jgi:hypothetical protein
MSIESRARQAEYHKRTVRINVSTWMEDFDFMDCVSDWQQFELNPFPKLTVAHWQTITLSVIVLLKMMKWFGSCLLAAERKRQ